MGNAFLLGDGTRLFAHAGGRQVRLERLSVTAPSHATNLWYRVLDWMTWSWRLAWTPYADDCRKSQSRPAHPQ